MKQGPADILSKLDQRKAGDSKPPEDQRCICRKRLLLPLLLLLAIAIVPMVTLSVCLSMRRGLVCLASPKVRQGDWGPWGGCDTQCGEGNRTRVRPPNSTPPDQQVELSSCSVPVKCSELFRWLDWAQWSPCTKSCSPGGNQHRSRQCQTFESVPVDAGKCSGEDNASQDCNTAVPCPEIHDWTQWSSWSSCTKTCAPDGVQSRTRQCRTAAGVAADASNCPGDSQENQGCNTGLSCIATYDWTQWSTWDTCTRNCGTDGVQTRTRQCQTGAKVVADASRCPGDSSEKQSCNVRDYCPPGWGTWSSWRACHQKTCRRARYRPCSEYGRPVSSRQCPGSKPASEQSEPCVGVPGCSR